MKVKIYYGGRGLLDDPTLYVLGRMQDVLEELHVQVERYNLYDMKTKITTLPQTLKDADGIILATTIEWYGLGGWLQQFLDACWLYGDKEKISKIYMCPVVMSTTYGEREGKTNLSVAWEILGGLHASGICGYIADAAAFEMNKEYLNLIEKKAENLYRTINQKVPCFPASNQAVKQKVSITKNIDLTPQESEQLSQYASDEGYVQKQKQDILELTSMFKDMLGNKEPDDTNSYIQEFEEKFTPQPGFRASYKFTLEDKSKPLILEIDITQMKCYYGEIEKADVEIQLKSTILDEITFGRKTFQRAFMGGDMKMKGDFKILRTLDLLFPFVK